MHEEAPISSGSIESTERSADSRTKALSAAREEILRLRELAYNDQLTGAKNRTAYEESLRSFLEENYGDDLNGFIREINESEATANIKRSPEQLGRGSVLLLDIDKFKDVNDTHGHEAGDRVLQAFANAVQTVLRRENDVLFRFGGEEFVALLPNTDEQSAVLLAEQIKDTVERVKVEVPELQEPLSVTVSIGVAQIIPPGETTDEVPEQFAPSERVVRVTRVDVDDAVRRADEALYAAKAEGRNQIRTGSDMLLDSSEAA